MWHLSFAWWEFVVRAAVVYAFVLLLIRLGGKREVGQMGVAEFVAILLVSNAVQNSMNGGDNSISGGLILSTVIIGLSVVVAYLTYKSRKLEQIIQGKPRILIRNGEVVPHNMHKELLSVHELKTILRRQGIQNLHDVALATLESDGYVSVTLKGDPSHGALSHSS